MMDMSLDPEQVAAGIPVGIPTGILPVDPGTCFPRIQPRLQVSPWEIINDLRVPVDLAPAKFLILKYTM